MLIVIGCAHQAQLLGHVRTSHGTELRVLERPCSDLLLRAETDLPCPRAEIVLERVAQTSSFEVEGCGMVGRYTCEASCALQWMRPLITTAED